VSASRGRICRFQALSCIRTMTIDSPCPARHQMDIARPDSATNGWEPTAETPSPPFGPGQIEAFGLRDRQLSIVGNSGVARPGLVIRSRSSQIGTPLTVRAPYRTALSKLPRLPCALSARVGALIGTTPESFGEALPGRFRRVAWSSARRAA